MLDNANDYDLDPELCECTRLISNTFTINSAGISPATRQREQRARGMQRRLNIAPTNINFDIKCDSPEKDSNLTEEDISFYSTNNPASSPRPCPISPSRDDVSLLSPGTSPSIFRIDSNVFNRLNSHDSSSRDSGYSGPDISNTRISSSSSSSVFQFVEPKLPETSSSPTLKTPAKFSSLNSSGSTRAGFTVFHSLSSGSGDSIDDDYMELMDLEMMDDDMQMPKDMNSLICKDIKSSKTPDRRPDSVRRSLNMEGTVKHSLFSPSPKTSTITSLITTPERQCLQSISENITPFGHRSATTGAFKRPEPPTMSPIQSKRHKGENEPPVLGSLLPFSQPHYFQQKRPVLRKSVSMNDAVIHDALARSSAEGTLIGDFSRSFVLPIIEGNHADLKSISAATMRELLLGGFEENVNSFKVIDCRYPYEFDGGHIRGAMNLYTHEQVLEELVTKKTESADGQKRDILIFHCEFSSERGPKLSRFLRNHDRTLNTYPSLLYPEVYLLHGGYKEFFERNSDLCDPIAYRPMNEPNFTEQLRHFRAKSKSWMSDVRGTALSRNKSRSRLVL